MDAATTLNRFSYHMACYCKPPGWNTSQDGYHRDRVLTSLGVIFGYIHTSDSKRIETGKYK
jgi:hypothetical protein